MKVSVVLELAPVVPASLVAESAVDPAPESVPVDVEDSAGLAVLEVVSPEGGG